MSILRECRVHLKKGSVKKTMKWKRWCLKSILRTSIIWKKTVIEMY